MSIRLVALCAWWEEDPKWLDRMVRSLPKAGVDHLVALDGAYSLVPGGTPGSDEQQAATIANACNEVGIGCSIHVPEKTWESETEKRTALFEAGQRHSPDWYFVMDADQIVKEADGVKELLENTDRDVAESRFWEPGTVTGPAANYSKWHREEFFPIRNFFRAIPGLKVETNHFTYTTPDGRKLWGMGRLEPCEKAPVLVHHLTRQRAPKRAAVQFAYYTMRDGLGLELGTCDRCGKEATKNMPAEWERDEKGMTATRTDVCAKHAHEVAAENDKALEAAGINPKTMTPDPLAVAFQ